MTATYPRLPRGLRPCGDGGWALRRLRFLDDPRSAEPLPCRSAERSPAARNAGHDPSPSPSVSLRRWRHAGRRRCAEPPISDFEAKYSVDHGRPLEYNGPLRRSHRGRRRRTLPYVFTIPSPMGQVPYRQYQIAHINYLVRLFLHLQVPRSHRPRQRSRTTRARFWAFVCLMGLCSADPGLTDSLTYNRPRCSLMRVLDPDKPPTIGPRSALRKLSADKTDASGYSRWLRLPPVAIS